MHSQNAVTARRARVGVLRGFCSPAERVPTGSLKTRRCANVQERCRNAKIRKRMPAGRFRQREKPQAAKQDKAAGACGIELIHYASAQGINILDCLLAGPKSRDIIGKGII